MPSCCMYHLIESLQQRPLSCIYPTKYVSFSAIYSMSLYSRFGEMFSAYVLEDTFYFYHLKPSLAIWSEF